MGPLLAEEELRQHGGAMSPEQLRSAVAAVTGSEREGDRAAAQREMARKRESSM